MASLLTFLSNHQGIFNADQVTVRYDRRCAPDGKSSGSPLLPWEPQGEHPPSPWGDLDHSLASLKAESYTRDPSAPRLRSLYNTHTHIVHLT